jgi:hypothetical protein
MHLARAIVVVCTASLAAAQPAPPLSDYNVTWSTPGPDASASMPMGNGEVGLNLWTDPKGDLVFYISRTDAWSEASRLMKIGRVRVSFDPPLVDDSHAFTQQLDLARGMIRVAATSPADSFGVDVFVHPDQPVVYVAGHADTPRRVTVSLEDWRTTALRLTGRGADAELTSSWTMHDAPDSVEVVESADHILDDPARLVWCHHNDSSVVPLSIKLQGLESIASSIDDPLLNRTFGGVLVAEPASGFMRPSSTALKSTKPLSDFTLRLVALTTQPASIEEWRIKTQAISDGAPAPAVARAECAGYWSDFWSRSYIYVDGDRVTGGIPANSHPVTLGEDSSGGNRFSGSFGRALLFNRVLSDSEVASLSATEHDAASPLLCSPVAAWRARAIDGTPAPDSAALEFPQGLTAEAWIRPDPALQAARIIDKVTPGQSDGFLFDIQPGATLRLIVGDQILAAPRSVKLGEWNHVAGTYDAATDRLRLFVDGRQVAASGGDNSPTPSLVTRGYVLQRWVQACGGRGNYPIKFNGSIFTVDAKYTSGVDASPDYRRWGDCFWWQNTRLPYHPMLASGDFEMMDALFKMYADVLPACTARAELYHRVAGAYFPETMTLNGLYSNGDYGWDRNGHDPSDIQCPWWQYAWNQGPELVALMLDRYNYTQDEAFAREELVPMASSILSYFDTRFKRDGNGKLIISPTQSIETYWHDVINDMPSVAGLHDTTTRLLALPASIGSAEDRALWQRLHDALPALPTQTIDGVRVYAPAEKFDPKRTNCETPELYNVFPHRLVGLDSPAADIEAAREAYRRRQDKATQGWTQDGQFAALLGLTDEAKANILAKARNSNPKHRFPAMWGPNFDWLPDQCHGSNLMDVLQCMLLQPRGNKILLLPAWPKEWNVSFKLHAPRNTIVECEYRDGKVTRLNVTPESRRADVVVMTP